jgi:hypothetical protein
MAVATSTVLMGIAAAGTVASIDQQKKAGRAQQRAFEAEQKKAEIQNVRAVRSQIRQARLAQSQMSNVAAQTGGMFGSGLAGGTASIASQTAGNINYMSQIAEQNTAIGNAQLASAKAQSNAAIYGQIGSMAGTIFGNMYAGNPQKTGPVELGGGG